MAAILTTMILEEIRSQSRLRPFIPFTLRLSDGRSFRVHHPDYIFVGHGPFVIIENDQGLTNYLPSLQISVMTVEVDPAALAVAA